MQILQGTKVKNKFLTFVAIEFKDNRQFIARAIYKEQETNSNSAVLGIMAEMEVLILPGTHYVPH